MIKRRKFHRLKWNVEVGDACGDGEPRTGPGVLAERWGAAAAGRHRAGSGAIMTGAALPPRLARMNRVPFRLLAWGLPMGPLVLLRTRGRRSGLPRTTPVALLELDGRQWLVSPFGETHWVRNARSDGRAELGRGRRFRKVRLTEIDDDRKHRIVSAYRHKYRVVPFVRDAFDTGPEATASPDSDRPVFLVERDA
jgi:deazaflavin-dependent oxidoreductase (nitroreductase family)